MSDRLFRRWLPVPTIERPRRPLSISASHASWSMRFSLRMMISGAPSSSSRLSRLLRLITRRYRSFRSDVAKRPPSSWTIGRRSGGMTGMTDMIIHSGRLPLRRKASIRRSRLIAFLRRWPELVRTSLCSRWARSSSSMRTISSRTASAPMPAPNRRAPPRTPVPYLRSSSRKLKPSSDVSGSISPGWILLISSRALRTSSLVPSASVFSRSRSASSVASSWSRPSSSWRRTDFSSFASRCWISSLARSISAAAALFSRVKAALSALSPAATIISPVGS